MATSSLAPLLTQYLQTVGGLLPEIVREDRFSLRLRCGLCSTEYSKRKSLLAWAISQGTQTGLACSRYCGTKRRHILHPEYGEQTRERCLGVPATGKHAKGVPQGPKSEETCARISATLRKIGWRPPIRKGNGTGLTAAEALLHPHLQLLGFEWNVPIALGGRQPGYPTCYKVDFGHRELKLALEVDGFSHASRARQAQDRKKEEKLSQLGWRVFRVKNTQVLSLSSISKWKDVLTILPEEFLSTIALR